MTASSQGGLRRLRFFLGAVHADQFAVLEEAVHGALDAEELGCQGGDFRGVHFAAPVRCRCSDLNTTASARKQSPHGSVGITPHTRSRQALAFLRAAQTQAEHGRDPRQASIPGA